MPRNGDGSGDSGPIDGHELIHGAGGDTKLQHTQHVAPMPKPEAGDALPGMNASGGAAAPLNDASEEYGASAPRHEKFGDDDQTSSSNNTGATSSSSGKSSSSGNAKSSGLNNISSEKAERYVNMNEEDVQHAGSTNKSSSGAERSKNRAPRDAGPKEDVEQLHGKASLAGNDRSQDGKHGSGGSGKSEGGKSEGGKSEGGKSEGGKSEGGKSEGGKSEGGKSEGGSHGGESGKKGSESEDHELESNMRHKAEKFVNLEDEE